jgi:hypothetical protein
MDGLGGFLPEEMVDPVDLVFLEPDVGDLVELLERGQRNAKGFLVDNPGAIGQAMLADRFGELGERQWRHGEVVDALRAAPELLLGLLEDLQKAPGVGGLEPPAGEAQARRELLPRPLGRLRPELLQALSDAFPEVFMRDVAATVADQAPVIG